MIDQRLIRSDPDFVREALSRRGAGDRVDAFLALDGRRRELLGRVEATRAERNAAAKAIAEARQRGEDATAEIVAQTELKAAQSAGEAELAELEPEIGELMLTIPNLPHPSAPIGTSRRGRGRAARRRQPARVRLRAARPPRHRRAPRASG